MPNPDGTDPKPEEGKTAGDPKPEGSTKTQIVEATVDGKTAAQWAETYKGLQRTFNDLKETSDQQKTTIATLEGDLKAAKAFEGQVDTLQNTVDQANQKLQAETTAKGKTELELARAKLIINDFPDLAKWEADNLLPTADTPEELKARFEKFQSNLGKKVDTGVEEALSGASPESVITPTKEGDETAEGETEDSLWEQLVTISKTKPFDSLKHAETQKKYDAIVKKRLAKTGARPV